MPLNFVQQWVDSIIIFVGLMFLAVIAWFLFDDLRGKG